MLHNELLALVARHAQQTAKWKPRRVTFHTIQQNTQHLEEFVLPAFDSLRRPNQRHFFHLCGRQILLVRLPELVERCRKPRLVSMQHKMSASLCCCALHIDQQIAPQWRRGSGRGRGQRNNCRRIQQEMQSNSFRRRKLAKVQAALEAGVRRRRERGRGDVHYAEVMRTMERRGGGAKLKTKKK